MSAVPRGFTEVFGGGNIYPVQPTYSQLTYSTNINLSWPIEQAIAGSMVVSDIIDLNPSGPGLTVTLPDAREVSTGYTALFNNVSAQTTSISSAANVTLISLIPGTVWQLYLTDNSTVGGTWRIFQFGASVSVAVASALAGAGLIPLGSTLNENMPVQPKDLSYTLINTDRASVIQWISGIGTFTLPAPSAVSSGWFAIIKNSGTGNLTISPTIGTIDSNATETLPPGASAWFVTDGQNFFSLLGGTLAGGGSGFNLAQIDVSGQGSFPLSGAQLNQIGYRFVGALNGARTIIVPNISQEYWVDNETTGAYPLSVGTSGQVSPIVVPPGNRYILYCDGTNVVNASTTSVVFPISIAQGGTGAITAPVALTNLGGSAVGVELFTAPTQAAAAAALGVTAATTQVIAGTWLTGGGALTGNVTLNVDNTKVQAIAPAQNIPDAAGNYTLTLTDNGNEIYHASAIAVTYTIPPMGTGAGQVNWPINAGVAILCGPIAGNITVAPGTGVSLYWINPSGTANYGNRTIGQNGAAFIFLRDTNSWLMWGSGIT